MRDIYYTGLLFVGSLTVMCKPFAVAYLKVCEACLKGRLLRAARIYSKLYLVRSLIHVADTHLLKSYAIAGALNAVIILAPAETVPH